MYRVVMGSGSGSVDVGTYQTRAAAIQVARTIPGGRVDTLLRNGRWVESWRRR